MAGKDRGKEGKILQVFPKHQKIVVEGLNIRIKHVRARSASQKGQKIEFPSPIDVSNVSLVCPRCAKPTRVGIAMAKDDAGKLDRSRVCKKCKATI